MTCAETVGSQPETRPVRVKKCRQCREPFNAYNTLAVACSPSCALKLATRNRERLEAKKQAQAREQVKSRRELMAEVQVAFNAWIRARDQGKPCISCGHPDNGTRQRHAGHFKPVGSNPSLRFEPANCHAQCQRCNTHLSGNLVPYREELIRRIGADRLEWLEGPHDPKKYTADDLRSMKKQYRKMARQASKITTAAR